MGLDAQEILKKYFDIPYGDRVVGESKIQNISNKNFDNSNNFPIDKVVDPSSLGSYLTISNHNALPKSIQFFHAGSNSSANYLRYLVLGAAVATAALESEDNVNSIFDHALKIKRVKYTIGLNSKNAVTTISLRKNNDDIDPSLVLNVDPLQLINFDSGNIDLEVLSTDKLCWKWDTSLSNAGWITVVYQAEVEIY